MTVRTWNGRRLPAAGVWTLEAGNSSIAFWVRHLGISRVRGVFNDFSGTIIVGERPQDSTVEVSVAAASIDTSMAARDRDLRGKWFLDVERHPALTFRSTSVAHAGDGLAVTGDLTIRDVTRPLVLDVAFEGVVADPWGHTKAVFSASGKLEREDFGLTYNQVLEGGGVLIGSTVSIRIEVQAEREQSAGE